MRVGFTLVGGAKWTGGRNYLLNLLAVLGCYGDGSVTSVLFVGTDISQAELQAFAGIPNLEIVRAACFSNGPHRRTALIRALLTGRDEDAAQAFERARIDVLFEAAQFYGWRLGMPAIAWIPDFQHRRLPQLFSRGAWLKREIGFRAQIFGKRMIMLSSQDALRDCEQFYPATLNRTFTVSFATLPRPVMSLEAAQDVARSYHLDAPFFFLPNQFWYHKNHRIVIEALALLRDRGRSITIAASGNQSDPRSPGHFQSLCDRIAELGLQKEFRLLGLVPYEHIGALLQSSAALINPSLFEGWSTVVEEARLLGTPMILSDLDVHKEQMGSAAVYFDRHSPASLAGCLDSFIPQSYEQRRASLHHAQLIGDDRARDFAQTFAKLLSHCVEQNISP
jgi:glycosyltransferase involved in cell wall biosynthesis